MEDVDFYNNPHFPILKSGKQINEKNHKKEAGWGWGGI